MQNFAKICKKKQQKFALDIAKNNKSLPKSKKQGKFVVAKHKNWGEKLAPNTKIYSDSSTFSSAIMPCSKVKPPCKYTIYGSRIGPSQLSSMEAP